MKISQIKILQGVPFNAEDDTVITFDNELQQQKFFEQFVEDEFEDVTFVKGFLYKKIKLDVSIEDVSYCNYVMYINKDHDDHLWIYAHITNFEYVSDACTYIEIEIDYIQTYMKEIIFAESLIDRMMSYNDTLSNQELFEPEDEIQPSSHITTKQDQFIISNWKVCVCYKPNLILESGKDVTDILSQALSGKTTYDYRDYLDQTKPYSTFFNKGGAIFNKYATGCAFRTYNIGNQNEITTFINDLWKLETFGYSILNVYMIPKGLNDINYNTDFTLTNTKNPYYTDRKIYVYGNPYQPINNKCFTTPYIYLELSNLQGEIKKYSYQFFLMSKTQSPKFKFRINETLLNRFDAVIYPIEYKNINWADSSDVNTYDYGMSIGVTPECQWNESLSNAIKSVAKTTLEVGIATAGIVATGGASAGAMIGRDALAFKGATESALANTDPSTKGVEALPVLQVMNDKVGWIFKQYACINIEEIDNYFSMYGYKFNQLNIPNILGNRRFNYVRIKDPKIMGNIPLNAKKIIIEKLKKGVTFWHDRNRFTYGTFRDIYSNEIVNKRLNNGKIFIN